MKTKIKDCLNCIQNYDADFSLFSLRKLLTKKLNALYRKADEISNDLSEENISNFNISAQDFIDMTKGNASVVDMRVSIKTLIRNIDLILGTGPIELL